MGKATPNPTLHQTLPRPLHATLLPPYTGKLTWCLHCVIEMPDTLIWGNFNITAAAMGCLAPYFTSTPTTRFDTSTAATTITGLHQLLAFIR